jgi:hypothetical protein
MDRPFLIRFGNIRFLNLKQTNLADSPIRQITLCLQFAGRHQGDYSVGDGLIAIIGIEALSSLSDFANYHRYLLPAR